MSHIYHRVCLVGEKPLCTTIEFWFSHKKDGCLEWTGSRLSCVIHFGSLLEAVRYGLAEKGELSAYLFSNQL